MGYIQIIFLRAYFNSRMMEFPKAETRDKQQNLLKRWVVIDFCTSFLLSAYHKGMSLMKMIISFSPFKACWLLDEPTGLTFNQAGHVCMT